MLNLIRTNSDNPDFISLVKQLDAYLTEKDGDDHSYYDQFNKLDNIKHVVLAYHENKVLACGAMKEYNSGCMEIKRMYTAPEGRNKGLATMILNELEAWAGELSYKKCVLETGLRQPEAIALYEKNGYKRIPNYGPYLNMDNSICFEKELR